MYYIKLVIQIIIFFVKCNKYSIEKNKFKQTLISSIIKIEFNLLFIIIKAYINMQIFLQITVCIYIIHFYIHHDTLIS